MNNEVYPVFMWHYNNSIINCVFESYCLLVEWALMRLLLKMGMSVPLFFIAMQR